MAEKYTPQDAYREHVEQALGAGSPLPVVFTELSDMAIQMYQTEADIINQQLDPQNLDKNN